MAKGILEIMSHLWLGLRPDQLSALLQRPSWRGFQKAPKPERWRVLDTPDQRHRETPLIVSPTAKGGTEALQPQFDLTRTRWTDGGLTLEHLVWRFPNGAAEPQAAWLRMPVGPSGDALRVQLHAMHADAQLAA
ncbi:hypothetical protein VZ95_17365, partial [Elstera litoralis]